MNREYAEIGRGFNSVELIDSIDAATSRLHAILSDKVMRFNPYSVDDAKLLECVDRATWLPHPALTQMAVFHFGDIRKMEWKHSFEAISYRIGNNPQEYTLPINALTESLVYRANRRPVKVMVAGRALANIGMLEKMQGKDYFVSHALPAERINGTFMPAYRMFRLRGKPDAKATLIREKMIAAKIEMLGEVMKYPYSPDYIHCRPGLIDYSYRITEAIEIIREFPNVLHTR